MFTRCSTVAALAVGLFVLLFVLLFAVAFRSNDLDPVSSDAPAVLPRSGGFDQAAIDARAIRIALATAAERAVGKPTAAFCFSPFSPPSPAAEAAVHAILGLGQDFNLAQRWSTTATNGSGLVNGQPTVLTYSFIPDGTSIPSASGLPGGASNLVSFLNGIYGGPTVWQAVFAQIFARWSALSGIDYVYEPQDDGAVHGSVGGVLGVRGDLRIGGVGLDGTNGVLAYNYFPDVGDMVIDTSDAFYNNTGSNSLALRNVLSHEHGHGIGLAHVCPVSQTKLMEPFVSFAFDGPQHDDIRAVQSFYGDTREPNNSVAAAATLTGVTATTSTVGDLSISAASDVDWYAISAPNPGMELNVTLRPTGSTYLSGPQNASGSCSAGSTLNSLTIADLDVAVFDKNGVTQLAAADFTGAGQNELLGATFLPSGAGNYFVRVRGSGSTSPQSYELDLSILPSTLPFSLSLPDGAPTAVVSGAPNTVRIQATNIAGSPNPTTATLFTSLNNAPFTAAPITWLGGGDYLAVLPPIACFATLRWYVAMTPAGGGLARMLPVGAPLAFFATAGDGVTTFDDDFQTNLGWSVTNDAALTDGQWERGVPAGGGARGDPPTDFDGSGQCYVTRNLAGNSDVDGGTTTLTSPLFNLAGQTEARVRFAFWYDNVFGSNPATDTFEIQATSNGTTWVTVESYNQSVGAWVERDLRVADFVAPTATVRWRFIAQDPAPGAVVEAGLDAFRVVTCDTGPGLGNYAAGSVGASTGTTVNVLAINGSAGGPRRRVDVATNASLVFSVINPPANPFSASYAVFGRLGVAGAQDIMAIGTFHPFAFPPCPTQPGNPFLFTLFDTFPLGNCAPIVGMNPAPATFTYLPGLPIATQLTLQGVIVDVSAPTTFAVTNAVILNVGP